MQPASRISLADTWPGLTATVFQRPGHPDTVQAFVQREEASEEVCRFMVFDMHKLFDRSLCGLSYVDWPHIEAELEQGGCWWLDGLRQRPASSTAAHTNISAIVRALFDSSAFLAWMPGIRRVYMFPAGFGTGSEVVRQKIRDHYVRHMRARAVPNSEYMMELPLH